MTKEELDRFVNYIIAEKCEGCTECEPRLSSAWKPNFACCIEGEAKWLIERAKEYAQKENIK